MARKKQALDGKRLNAFGKNPNDLVIVGLDVIVPEDHELFELYDERIKKPLVERTIRDMMRAGVVLDIVARKYTFAKGTVVWGKPLAQDTDLPVVVDGRRRTQHSREANRRLDEKGEPLIVVPVKQWKGTIRDASLRMVALNAHREDDDVLTLARKASSMLARVKNEDDVAEHFNVSTHQLREWLRLLEASPAVVKAVEKGSLPASSAIELTRLPPDHQKVELEAAIAAGETSKSKVTARVRRKIAEGKGVKKSELPGKPPTVRELREVWEFIRESNSDLLDGMESVEQSAMGFLGIVCDGVFDSSKASKLIAHSLKKLADAKAEARKSKGKKPAEVVT